MRKLDPEENEARVKKQRQIANNIEASQKESETRHQDAHTDSVATVDSHVGKAPHDTSKPRAMEGLKTDLDKVTGDPHLEREPLTTEGKGTTDLVTSQPEGAQPQGGAESFKDRAAAAAKAGKKKSAKRRN